MEVWQEPSVYVLPQQPMTNVPMPFTSVTSTAIALQRVQRIQQIDQGTCRGTMKTTMVSTCPTE